MAGRGRGTEPHLRGLPNSVLFLYDGVPISTDVTKSLAPLDNEIGLFAVDRVEIVRGPGSALWGPDAFAGVVNIVPLRGRKRPGLETGLSVGSDHLREVTATWGKTTPKWDGFLALSGQRERFHDPEFTAVENGTATLASSGYGEAVATLHYGDWLHVTGRWSDFTRRYTMRNSDDTLRWAGEKEAPVNLLKVSATKAVGPSHYTLAGFLQQIDFRIQDADIERGQRNLVSHVELLWDRRLLSRGLLSAGASLRRNSVSGAMVRDGFLPEFLTPAASLFVPAIEQEDFSNDLASLFSQFRYRVGETEWWAGVRRDNHSQYSPTTSFSLGLNRPLPADLRFKAAYGTAFRSPYSSQLFDNLAFEPEAIRTLSAQLAWAPSSGRLLELTLFHSDIDNHRSEDPYGGLSLPSERRVYGGELSGRFPLGRTLELAADLSLTESSSGEERFRTLLFSFIRPDGSEVAEFEQWDEPFDQGPGWLARLGLNWRLGPGHTLALRGRSSGPLSFSYEKGSDEGRYSPPLLIDLAYRRPGFLAGRDTLQLTVANLLDQDYQQADIFGPVSGAPLQATLVWLYRF
jgi:outer membrane receptor protein involved in Fe transport